MEYINKFLVLAGLNLRLLRLKNEHENVDKIAELENIIGAISGTETTDAIEREKIDKAIKEIEKESYSESVYGDLYKETTKVISVDDVLEIIKRNIGE